MTIDIVSLLYNLTSLVFRSELTVSTKLADNVQTPLTLNHGFCPVLAVIIHAKLASFFYYFILLLNSQN